MKPQAAHHPEASGPFATVQESRDNEIALHSNSKTVAEAEAPAPHSPIDDVAIRKVVEFPLRPQGSRKPVINDGVPLASFA